MRPRHSDADLVDLARSGSAPAFASLIHRHRDVVQRTALRSAHPEQAAESIMRSGMARLRRADVRPEDLRTWLTELAEQQVLSDPGHPHVERMLPGDWFDRAWVRAEPSWPTGRRARRPPRWARTTLGALLLAVLGAGTTYLAVTAERTTEFVSELVAEPIDDPDVLVVPGPVLEQEPEDAPELFGDVELGELPTYDLTGEGDRRPTSGPEIGPPPDAGDGSTERPEDDGATEDDGEGAGEG